MKNPGIRFSCLSVDDGGCRGNLRPVIVTDDIPDNVERFEASLDILLAGKSND